MWINWACDYTPSLNFENALKVPVWNLEALWKDWGSLLLVCNSFLICQVWWTHSVNSHRLWKKETKLWGEICHPNVTIAKKNGDKAYCDNIGFFEFDQSCWFYQSFQTPPEQAHQQTCFGYHVLGHYKQNLPQWLEYNRIYRTHWTNQED